MSGIHRDASHLFMIPGSIMVTISWMKSGETTVSLRWRVAAVRFQAGCLISAEVAESPIPSSLVCFDSFKYDAYKQTTSSATDKDLLATFFTGDI